ncbi:helix-turn-helix transcriptional regulator [uncultured Roseicyclus sp.]|jgi:HTH-type transcriptional regulator, cell division transcriptional repressor|uniref:helix-turn-helix domain-containing protein n=1 Tax=uncultured Roseicyclus sp. TaxID=543072 RepID=UPI00260C8279|nr:helix-turn-helix transcriptional regulator [uncultured Roseicyclus sp.]
MTGDVTLGPGWYDADTATLGDRITGAREAAGLSQTELARRLGVRLATIRAWEDDQADPRANKLQMLAGLLGVSIMWLLTGKGDGLDSPAQNAPLPDDLLALLAELRQMRLDQARMADRMGRLDKRLRLALSQRG